MDDHYLMLAESADQGLPLADELQRRVGPRAARSLGALLQGWSLVLDELRNRGENREPTITEYAERFGIARTTAHRELDLFRKAFPGEESPTRIVDLIWEGISAKSRRSLGVFSFLGVRVACDAQEGYRVRRVVDRLRAGDDTLDDVSVEELRQAREAIEREVQSRGHSDA